MNNNDQQWLEKVKAKIRDFANEYNAVYSKDDRALAAYFEIGCFLSLIQFYENIGFVGQIQNPDKDGAFKYLTTPSGNPNNFSFMLMTSDEESIEIRQQVRIKSHIGDYVSFTPDIIVIPKNEKILDKKDVDYASGKRRFFYITSDKVIAAHECKSLVPFPELLISFLGTLLAGHFWYENYNIDEIVDDNGNHLAPALFVGGSARALHLKMVSGLRNSYPINIILGLHAGIFNLLGEHAEIKRIRNPLK